MSSHLRRLKNADAILPFPVDSSPLVILVAAHKLLHKGPNPVVEVEYHNPPRENQMFHLRIQKNIIRSCMMETMTY